MILRDVTLKIEPGQVVCLMGRNGVGKTTLMKSIMGLLLPKQGTIECQDQAITSFPPDRTAKIGIGYVPKKRDIFSSLTVEENLLLGLEAANPKLLLLDEPMEGIQPLIVIEIEQVIESIKRERDVPYYSLCKVLPSLRQ
jgi:urea transport system ATP-binding protein